MSREVKRVPLDFEWPLGEIWSGYVFPEELSGADCPGRCGNGWSAEAAKFVDQWYGNAPFSPSETGSTPFLPTEPPIRDRARRNVGTNPVFVDEEADRLAELFNRCWMHHLAQVDVDALLDAGRLFDFTYKSGVLIEPRPEVTAAEVNRWSITGFGHDQINMMICVSARCTREGVPENCATCGGEGTVEKYPGQSAAAEAWTRTDPPAGDGWQMWETVSEGSPMSPVFATAEELARWLADTGASAMGSQTATYEHWLAMIHAGYSVGTGVIVNGRHIDGVTAVSEL